MKRVVFLASLVIISSNVCGMPRFSINLSQDVRSLKRVKSNQNLKTYQKTTSHKSKNDLREKLDTCIWNYRDSRGSMDIASLEELLKSFSAIADANKNVSFLKNSPSSSTQYIHSFSEKSSDFRNKKHKLKKIFNKKKITQTLDKVKIYSIFKWINPCKH